MANRLINDNTYRVFLINISIVITVIISGIFTGLFIRNNELVNKELRAGARAAFNNILLARRWNAGYGGVYVEKKEGVESNPYLEDPDIRTVDGKVYTKKNPALMTREISEIAGKYGIFTFHITSLNPINPDNRPDRFEREALALFETGEDEIYRKELIRGKIHYRYMAPLYVEESCLECHAQQGYKFGDVRGGISIQYNIDETERMLRNNNYIIVALGIITLSLLLGIIWFLVYRLMKKHNLAQKRIKEMAVTDELTGLYNRRHLFLQLKEEVKRAVRFRRRLGCVMIDLDYFKQINDTFGHHAGDIVLRIVAETIKASCREIDMVARYGGEEILILSPEMDIIGLHAFAERLRTAVEQLKITLESGREIKVTISLGIASLAPEQLAGFESDEQIIKLADEALYYAKKNGRNRVETY
jgi:diguanylate cyclase (GGDEF)-like protein